MINNISFNNCSSISINWAGRSAVDIINPYNDSAAVDSSVVKPCRDTTGFEEIKKAREGVKDKTVGEFVDEKKVKENTFKQAFEKRC